MMPLTMDWTGSLSMWTTTELIYSRILKTLRKH